MYVAKNVVIYQYELIDNAKEEAKLEAQKIIKKIEEP